MFIYIYAYINVQYGHLIYAHILYMYILKYVVIYVYCIHAYIHVIKYVHVNMYVYRCRYVHACTPVRICTWALVYLSVLLGTVSFGVPFGDLGFKMCTCCSIKALVVQLFINTIHRVAPPLWQWSSYNSRGNNKLYMAMGQKKPLALVNSKVGGKSM
jgi:hypothetical protein